MFCWIALICFTIIYIIKELTSIYHKKTEYLKFENLLNLMNIISFILISFHANPILYDDQEIKMGRWQYTINGFGVFCTWLLLMILVGRIPKFGLYIEIFKKVSNTFLKFLWSFLSLIMAFAMSFFVLFPAYRSFEQIGMISHKMSLITIFGSQA